MAAKKRKAVESVSNTAVRFRTTKRTKFAAKKKAEFIWKEKDWVLKEEIDERGRVKLLQNKNTHKLLIVKKNLRKADDASDQKHFEVRALELLPNCNRIVQLLGYDHGYPADKFGIAFFEYYPLGDLADWKEREFDMKNFKPIPESYIWRFFIQTTQALAFIHNQLGPNHTAILHRDLKPKNILVCKNGTTYPSFKLHDFGCGTCLTGGTSEKGSLAGTFEWQAPENPMINTKAAEIWSLGACIHFLVVDRPPTRSTYQYKADIRKQNGGRDPISAKSYSGSDQYYRARVSRKVWPINSTPQEQEARGFGPRENGRPFIPTRSDQLNHWMQRVLSFNPAKRATAKELLDKMIPEGTAILRTLSGRNGLVDLDVHFQMHCDRKPI